MFRALSIQELSAFYKGLEFAKGTGTLTSTATNYVNRVFGAMIFWQTLRRANALSALPVVEYPHSGWRVIPSNPSTKSNIVPSAEDVLGTAVFPDIVNLHTSPRIISQVAEITDVLESLSAVRDDVAMEAAQLKIHLGQGVVSAHNEQILHPITSAPIANAWTSLDWIVAKHNEQGKDAGWGNTLFGIDRSLAANSWHNAYVDDAATIRNLTKDMLINALTHVRTQGAEPTCWLMHPSAVGDIQGIFDSQVLLNILGEKKIKVDVNGVSSYDGYGVGLVVSSLFGFPVIPDPHIAKGTTDIGRIYLLSYNNEQGIGPEIGRAYLMPYTFYESRDFTAMNKPVIRFAVRAFGDIVCRRVNINAKIRDIN